MILAATGGTNPTAILSSAVYHNATLNEHVKIAPDKMDIWLEKLAKKESRGRSNIKILDVNNRHSYGCLQFQMETFKGYSKKYDLLPEAEDKEFENMIYDCNFQKLLARKMIEERYDNWRHWYNSVNSKHVGLPPKPEITDIAKVD